ncbi:hypothetical protein B0H13DRAFT_2312620 [Mycena leptocephala]|nr:hypothetical protein B0H13DRAFT_2312620 [Mycena leptocephala]
MHVPLLLLIVVLDAPRPFQAPVSALRSPLPVIRLSCTAPITRPCDPMKHEGTWGFFPETFNIAAPTPAPSTTSRVPFGDTTNTMASAAAAPLSVPMPYVVRVDLLTFAEWPGCPRHRSSKNPSLSPQGVAEVQQVIN